MQRGFHRRLLALAVSMLAAAGCGDNTSPVAPSPGEPYPPVVISGPWAEELSRFDREDRADPPPGGGIVFVGSSSIRFWDLNAYFPGRGYLNRGFGGSQIADSIAYLDLLVLRHAPRTVVLYAGDNDIAFGKSPEQVAADFATFARDLHAVLPATRLLFLAIKPSIARWHLIGEMRDANARIRAFCETDGGSTYVDVHAPMIGEDGMPRPELLASDGLHLSPAGYALWTRILEPFLD